MWPRSVDDQRRSEEMVRVRFWLAKHVVRALIVLIGVSILTLQLSRAALRGAIRWL